MKLKMWCIPVLFLLACGPNDDFPDCKEALDADLLNTVEPEGLTPDAYHVCERWPDFEGEVVYAGYCNEVYPCGYWAPDGHWVPVVLEPGEERADLCGKVPKFSKTMCYNG